MLDLEYNKHANPTLNPSTTKDLLTELFHELAFQFNDSNEGEEERGGSIRRAEAAFIRRGRR